MIVWRSALAGGRSPGGVASRSRAKSAPSGLRLSGSNDPFSTIGAPAANSPRRCDGPARDRRRSGPGSARARRRRPSAHGPLAARSSKRASRSSGPWRCTHSRIAETWRLAWKKLSRCRCRSSTERAKGSCAFSSKTPSVPVLRSKTRASRSVRASPLRFSSTRPCAQDEAPVAEEAVEVLPEDPLAQIGAVVILLCVAAAQLAREEDQWLPEQAKCRPDHPTLVETDQRRRGAARRGRGTLPRIDPPACGPARRSLPRACQAPSEWCQPIG